MRPPEESVSDHDRRLDEAVAEFFHLVEQGQAVEPAAFLARYPNLAQDLRAFFEARRDFEAALGRAAAAVPAPVLPGEDTKLDAEDTAVSGRKGPAGSRSLGDYDLLEELPGVGVGVVWRAWRRTESRSALLTLLTAPPADPARFEARARALAGLDHPHLLPLLQAGEVDGRTVIAMKLVPARRLDVLLPELLRAPRRLGGVVARCARAAHHAHTHGLAHGALGPPAVLVDDGGSPWVDFTAALVSTGEAAADVRALAEMLAACLAGRPDGDLQLIVQKARADRGYQTAAALADDLDRWLAGERVARRQSAWAWARRRPAAVLLAVLLVCLLPLSVILLARASKLRRAEVQHSSASSDPASARAEGATAAHRLGVALMERGQYKEALEAFDRAALLQPDLWEAHDDRLLALLALGRTDAYRQSLGELLLRFGRNNTPAVKAGLLAACVRIPAAVDVLPLLRLALADPPGERGPALLGASLCRAGLHEVAVRELLAAGHGPDVPFFLALSYQALGKKAEAAAALARGVRMMEEAEKQKSLTWRQRVSLAALRQEAGRAPGK
jgi:serine/threonine-protein kinase